MAKAQTPTEVKIVRPKDLADTLEIDGKTLRSFLRREFPRDPAEKNTSWVLTEEMVEKATAHFEETDEDDSDDDPDDEDES